MKIFATEFAGTVIVGSPEVKRATVEGSGRESSSKVTLNGKFQSAALVASGSVGPVPVGIAIVTSCQESQRCTVESATLSAVTR